MFDGFTSGLTLGLATGTACLVTCGPIYGAYLLSEKRKGFQSLSVIILLSTGRFISYALFGALLGYLGGAISSSIRIPIAFSGYILFSTYLFVSTIRTEKECTGCKTGKLLKITRSPFLLGILTGLSICPAFLMP